jgi:hypothetical protein
VPFGGKHLCPSCLDSAKLPELLSKRLIWGQLAMILGWLPLAGAIFCFPLWFIFLMGGFVTGPSAIFVALWGWNKPPSLVHGHRRGSAVLGIIGGLLQIAGIIALIWGMAWLFREGVRR